MGVLAYAQEHARECDPSSSASNYSQTTVG
jgi:hypothetical protein